ncbi:MAG TPA: hypothetical protein VGI72_00690 [Gaiellales bacterium]|jgi:hypothetical protein
MTRFDTLDVLRRLDPARSIAPADAHVREAVRSQIVAVPIRTSVRRPHRRRAPVLAAAAALLLAVGIGAAWATGALGPVALFRANSAYNNDPSAGQLWHQHVIPASVFKAATMRVPRVGPVQFWFGRTRTHGWCGALRLPAGDWVGTGRDPLDGGGTVPGCMPTRTQVNGQDPVYVINGFDYQEGDVNATGRGGSFWRIEYGLITIRDAVRVADRVSGRGAPIARGGAFALALPFPDGNSAPMHLVAYNAEGKVVGRA